MEKDANIVNVMGIIFFVIISLSIAADIFTSKCIGSQSIPKEFIKLQVL